MLNKINGPKYEYLRINEELRRVRIQIFWLLRRVAIISGEDEVVLSICQKTGKLHDSRLRGIM